MGLVFEAVCALVPGHGVQLPWLRMVKGLDPFLLQASLFPPTHTHTGGLEAGHDALTLLNYHATTTPLSCSEGVAIQFENP